MAIFNITFLLREFSRNSFFVHRRCRPAYDQISAVSFNENKNVHQLQTGLVRYMILKLHGNETRSSFDKRLFFLSALCALFSINKRKISSGTARVKKKLINRYTYF